MAGVAQLVEPQIVTLVVAGSSPVARPIKNATVVLCRGVLRFRQWYLAVSHGHLYPAHTFALRPASRDVASW